jgi:hypothetical protein
MDSATAQVVVAIFGVANTALLVYQAVRLNQVHETVNGAKQAAVEAAHQSGYVAGLMAPVGKSPTGTSGVPPQ